MSLKGVLLEKKDMFVADGRVVEMRNKGIEIFVADPFFLRSHFVVDHAMRFWHVSLH